MSAEANGTSCISVKIPLVRVRLEWEDGGAAVDLPLIASYQWQRKTLDELSKVEGSTWDDYYARLQEWASQHGGPTLERHQLEDVHYHIEAQYLEKKGQREASMRKLRGWPASTPESTSSS